MSKFLYLKLAKDNIKKNSQTYVPYLLTCICSIVMFYNMTSLRFNPGLNEIIGSDNLKVILALGVTIIGIFSAIFLFYTNSFLIKRRKKELGLYTALGLEKKHITYILGYENLILSTVSLVVGLLSGVILNKLMFMFLGQLIQVEIPYEFMVSNITLVITIVVFVIIFTINLLTNMIHLLKSNPIELLKGGQVGEKEPKSQWFRAFVGLVSLGIGYVGALSAEEPLLALNTFFVATLFVMIGTYELFTAGSIIILKWCRKNKRFYYQPRHFIVISGMIYRMKQNAVGLANICILSTAVLIMISTTASLYVGMEDALRFRFQHDISLGIEKPSVEEVERLNQLVHSQMTNHQLELIELNKYHARSAMSSYVDEEFTITDSMSRDYDSVFLRIVPLADYEAMIGKDINLNEDELLLFSTSADYGKDSMVIDGVVYQIKEELQDVSFSSKNHADTMTTYYLITNDFDLLGNDKIAYYYISMDIKNSDEESIAFVNDLKQEMQEAELTVVTQSIASERDSFLSMYGGLFFIGIFLGGLFLMATVLIIYYKQISEGYDDKTRFEIMQKVGMSKDEIKRTVKTQVLFVFFLPLLFTFLHIAVAFPIITKLLVILNLVNVKLFFMTTIISSVIFAIVYIIIYRLTARTYYKIVK